MLPLNIVRGAVGASPIRSRLVRLPIWLFAAGVGVLGGGRADSVASERGEPEAAALAYAPAPPDNPLKGFVPYLRENRRFPHSMEWDYTALAQVMRGPDTFDWTPFETKLRQAAERGHQFIARFYLEWPGKKTGVPQYLIADGLKMREWLNRNTQPLPPAQDLTPDYEDPRLRQALVQFIRAFGAKYDGDPRIGFIGLGLLGTWGEWHNHPNDQWFASKAVQREVMDAYERAFRKTKLVARYPAGSSDPRYAENTHRPMGYHDDSFVWATVDTGRREDAWFFETRLRAARAMEKWRTQPIGGEVRPEVWRCLFDEPSCAPPGQEFERALAVTHASWLCNEGVFRSDFGGESRDRAIRAARSLGYELHVRERSITRRDDHLRVRLRVTNKGVAPFYYDWPVELAVLDAAGVIRARWQPAWTLSTILPGEPDTLWEYRSDSAGGLESGWAVVLRVPNPLPNGTPLRFANQSQDQHLAGWLTLGSIP